MTITTDAVTRAVVYEDRDRDEDEDRLDRLGEIEQQLQIAILGTANGDIAWTELDVTLDVEFLDATDQRYSNLTTPLVSFGYGIDGATPVVVTGCGRGWVTDDRGVVVGVTLAIGVFSPGEEDGIAFSGHADFSIQGYGCVPSEPNDVDFDFG